VSAVTVWEIALLVDTGRIELDIPVEAWVERFLERPGIEAVSQGYRTASRAYQLHHLEHRDPADRLLISTAIELACPLVTYDERIARLGKRRGRQYRFAVVSVDDDLHQGGLYEISESGAQCVVERLAAVD
jgi:PIN domain nuclease of toxin-antitoxin system